MKKLLVGVVAVFAVAAVTLGVMRPWESNIAEAIDEELPVAASAEVSESQDAGGHSQSQGQGLAKQNKANKPKAIKESQPPEPTGPTVLASGDFEDAEYDTNGVAKIVELADGQRVLRIENFSTSDAPVVKVALSASPSGGEWGSYDDQRIERLGDLKALTGDQNYEIPGGLDLDGLKSVVIWCEKYSVALGTAPISV